MRGVALLPGGQAEGERVAEGVGEAVQLGGETAARAAKRLLACGFFPRRRRRGHAPRCCRASPTRGRHRPPDDPSASPRFPSPASARTACRRCSSGRPCPAPAARRNPPVPSTAPPPRSDESPAPDRHRSQDTLSRSRTPAPTERRATAAACGKPQSPFTHRRLLPHAQIKCRQNLGDEDTADSTMQAPRRCDHRQPPPRAMP